MTELQRGHVVWTFFGPGVGKEQSGRRPAVVVSSDEYLRRVVDLAVVVPITSKIRGWPNHVLLKGERLGLDETSFAMTEQVTTIDRRRIRRLAGRSDDATMDEIDRWLTGLLGLRE